MPPAIIHVPNVRIRLYRGFCVHSDQVQAFAAGLLAHRADMLAILDQTPGLDDNMRGLADRYLSGFFDLIASPQQVAAIMQPCLH